MKPLNKIRKALGYFDKYVWVQFLNQRILNHNDKSESSNWSLHCVTHCWTIWVSQYRLPFWMFLIIIITQRWQLPSGRGCPIVASLAPLATFTTRVQRPRAKNTSGARASVLRHRYRLAAVSAIRRCAVYAQATVLACASVWWLMAEGSGLNMWQWWYLLGASFCPRIRPCEFAYSALILCKYNIAYAICW